MNKRIEDLLGEMKDIFGSSFGEAEPQSLEEGRRALHGGRPFPQQSRGRSSKKDALKGVVRGQQKKNKGKKKAHAGLIGLKGKDVEIAKKRGEEGLRSFHKHAAKEMGKREQELKKKEGEARYKSAMRDIQKEIGKREKELAAKKKGKAGPGGEVTSLGGAGSRPEKKQQGRTLAQKTPRRHFPFKRSSDLGPGPRGRKHRETKCWKCKCGNVYRDGCHCTSSGSGKNCPPKGTMKTISYTPSYKQAYNREYHAWRARQGARATQKLGATRTAL